MDDTKITALAGNFIRIDNCLINLSNVDLVFKSSVPEKIEIYFSSGSDDNRLSLGINYEDFVDAISRVYSS